MKTWAGNFLTGMFAVFLAINAPAAAVRYVNLNNASPAPPYADWNTAATDIQSAIDAASAGDLILVTNGIYQTGGRVVYGSLTNRVVIDKAVTVQSVNGPDVTVIQGHQVPGTLNDDTAIRCVYLTNNAALIGFTLTGGATRNSYDFNTNVKERSGGGAWCESSSSMISNCVVAGNSCYWYGAGVYSGTVIGCQISNNTNNNGSLGGGGGAAFSTLLNSTISSNYLRNPGGGAFSCTLSDCVIAGNAMGGVLNCVLTNCTVENNTNNLTGGGASQSLLNHCRVYNNSARDGGGAYQCELNFCTVSNNLASHWGGGVYEIANTTNRAGANNYVVGNSAAFLGGGAYFTPSGQFASTNWDFSGWTFSSNSATRDGGGLYSGGLYLPLVVNNCVFNGNLAGGGGGGLCNSSPLTIISTLIIASNCTFTGNSAIGNGGGAYAGSLINCTVVGNQGGNGGGVYGLINNCVLNDNIAATNGGGVFLFTSVAAAITCSNSFFTNNLAENGGGAYGWPDVTFSNCIFWGNTAITNGGGIYQTTLKNCLIVSNQATVGGGGFGAFFQNCTISNNQATLGGGGCGGGFADCSIAGNLATDSGGGIYYNSLNSSPTFATNCIFKDNHAATNGGGAYSKNSVNLNRCRFFSNSAGANGGGAYGMNLANCLLAGNSAANGGGAYSASSLSLYNSTFVGNTATTTGGGMRFLTPVLVTSCIIYDNYAPAGANYFGISSGMANCTTPLLPGPGNITNNPVFVDFAAGNFRIQTNSPCINTGSTGPSPVYVDLDGRPRIVGGRIDIGAYEFQGPGMGEFIGWLEHYGLPTDGLADTVDADGDGLNNWQEWIAKTIPTNAASVLQLASPVKDQSGVTLTWQSVSGVTYYLQRSTNLQVQPAFSSIESNLLGQAGLTSYQDMTATNAGPFFYRVGVQ